MVAPQPSWFVHAAKPGSFNGIPARTADGTCKSVLSFKSFKSFKRI